MMIVRLCLVTCLVSLGNVGLNAQTRLPLPSPYIPGYARTLAGEELRYHSPLPDVDRSLLVRSLDRSRHIVWETEPVPTATADDPVTFAIMAGIDVNERPRRFDLFVGGDSVLAFFNPTGAAPGDTLVWIGERGARAEFRVVLIDKYGDAMGFLFLRLPRGQWRAGQPLRLRVAGESAGERTWFMIFKEPIAPRVTLRNAPVLLRGSPENRQSLRVDVLYLGAEGTLRMSSPIGAIDEDLALGHNGFVVPVPEVARPLPVPLAFTVDGEESNTSFTVRPVRRMTVHLIHHTHLDIGYTHRQDEVERLQWQHLEEALRYGAASADYPEDARFVWHPEGLWAVESYLQSHAPEDVERLREGIRRGWIHLDALFANLLTGIASSEGLMQALAAARRLSAWSGVPIESAMASDIPGFTWGMVPVLAQHGIKYLSIGPNFGHRTGRFLEELGDRPFYWESPSGSERVLTWVSGAGYAMFHSGLGYSTITRRLDEASVFEYVERLTESGYPYDMVHLRYNIGSDNGPPDPSLADAVRAWNQRYVSPRLVISDVSRTFRQFEERYGETLPIHRGDLTGHWEDGAASSARETARVRRAAESLIQAEALAALLDVDLPRGEVDEAWRQVLLFYEHTWGSWNSISEPESEFTASQWEHKRTFAESAAKMAERLLKLALVDRWDASVAPRMIEVINTASWPRSDVIFLSPQASRAGDAVQDADGRIVPSQRLTSGELAFRADSVPAFGARRFFILDDSVARFSSAERRKNVIANRRYRVEVDTLRGTFSLFCAKLGRDLAAPGGLNEYVYVPGRAPSGALTGGPPTVRVTERGPVVWAVEVVRAAPGADDGGIRSEIQLYAGSDRIDVINSIDKARTYDPEAVLYRFSLNLRDPRVRIDVPWASYRPELDQLPGAAKNYLSLQRWVDVQGARVGITLVSIDAPLIQLGQIRTDAIVTGWLDHLPQSATLFSYVMNNYWETNYRAGQEGIHHFRYSLRPRVAFDEAQTERFASGVAQPLIAVPVRRELPALKPPVNIVAARAVVTRLRPADDGDGLVARLYNPGSPPDTVAFRWPDGRSAVVWRSDPWGRALEPLGDTLPLGAYEIATVRIPQHEP